MSEKKIGAKIVIDGEQEFRSALNQSKTALKEFDSELKLVTTQFKNNEKSMEALKSKQAVYQKQQQELTKQSKILVEQIQKANEAYKKAEDAQAKQVEKIKRLESALEKAKKEYGESSDEVKQLEAELSEANQEYEKQERSITQLSNKISKWNTDLNKTETELVECDRALEETNDAIENYGKEVDEAGNETKKFGIVMKDAGDGTEKLRVSLGSLVSAQVVVDVLRNCAHAIKEVATAAVDVGMKFEASMSNVQALSGASGESLEKLTAKAKEMGAQTIYSASESADAFSYMALAGWDVEQMLEGINPVLNLAASANMDLAEASDIVTDYITAFGLKASDAAHFSDAMAKAMSTSNTTVQQLGEAYKNCAATCGAMGIEMEDATAVLATMANAGVKGGEAGTALNSILTRLATNTKDCADKLKNYGVDVYDPVSGNMKSLSSILNGLGEVWGTLSQQEQAALAKSIAGVSHYSKFQTIMLGVSEAAKDGGMSFDDYAASLRNCEGAAEDMARVMQDNLAGDITILKSALEGLGIATEGVFDEAFREAVQGATDAVGRLEKSVSSGDLGVSLAGLGDALADMTESLVDAAEQSLPGFINGLTTLINNLDIVGGAIEGAAAAFAAYKIASIAATIATEGFTVAISANPIGLLAAGLTAAIMAVKVYTDELYEASQETHGQTAETEALIEKVNEFNQSSRELVSNYRDQTSAMDSQAETAHKLVAELFDASTSEEKLKEAVGQLKAIYPELNVELDEHGRIVGATREEMDKYIDSSLKMAKVEAAKEHLTEIAKKQFEAEQKLAEQEKNLSKQANEVADAQIRFNEVAKDGDSIFTAFSQDLYDSRNALNQAKEGYDNAKDSISETNNVIKELGDDYQETLAYIENNEAIDQAAASINEMGDAFERTVQLTEDQQKELEELENSIMSSIGSSLDLTKSWSQEWSTSTEQMTKNVQSQIEGVQNWSDNFQRLAENSKVAIDDRVMKYLADMGTEGAGLVQQLTDELDKSPEKLQGWADKMAEYLSLQGEVASQIGDSYMNVVLDGIDQAKTAMESEGSEALVGATNTMMENVVSAIQDSAAAEAFEKMGKSSAEAAAKGLEGNESTVSDAGKKVVTEAAESTKKEAETKFKDTGKAADQALGEGVKSGEALAAAQETATQIDDTVSSILSHDSGYSIGKDWMSGLAEAIEKSGEKVIKNAQKIADKAKEAMESAGDGDDKGEDIPGHKSGLAYVPYDDYLARLHEGERVLTREENEAYSRLVGAIQGPSFNVMQSGITTMYSQAVEALDRIGGMGSGFNGANEVSVNVELYGDAKDIFKVVRNQNTRLVTATGYNALA